MTRWPEYSSESHQAASKPPDGTQTVTRREVPYEVTDELISVEEVSVVFGAKDKAFGAVKNVNLAIFAGEFVCLMGPSGCGKSTVLNVLAGFNHPSSGRVTLRGQPISGIDRHRGVVFQKPALFEWFSVAKNIAFGLKVMKRPKAEIKDKVAQYLQSVGLTGFADHKVYELSGGMRQRVAIARSLITEPEILLMDEPFGALDALTREQMQNLVRDIWWRTGKTIFFITHDVDEALKLGTRILVMSPRPGTIIDNIESGFSRSLLERADDRVWFSEDFYRARRHLLSMVTGKPAPQCGPEDEGPTF
ncbi:MAG: ABC transporter ATP-binding protein [Deltaproteobacteria bacterium]|jgi:taurine transport system ATP-binding protein|nr:ABC transporter ATP-binding protein [Deltaproteobacteria bacterium]